MRSNMGDRPLVRRDPEALWQGLSASAQGRLAGEAGGPSAGVKPAAALKPGLY